MNQRVNEPFFPNGAIAALFALCGCGGVTHFEVPRESTPVELWQVPDRARRVAEALMPQGEWVTIAHERHGSRDYWRLARRVLPLDLRVLLLDDEGAVAYRDP